MADLWRLVYVSSGPQDEKVAVVSATSLANAIAAAKANDSTHKAHVTGTVVAHNIIIGS